MRKKFFSQETEEYQQNFLKKAIKKEKKAVIKSIRKDQLVLGME